MMALSFKKWENNELALDYVESLEITLSVKEIRVCSFTVIKPTNLLTIQNVKNQKKVSTALPLNMG